MLKIYSIFDKKSETFSNPVFSVNDNVIKRDLLMVQRDPKSLLALYPEDYDLMFLGSFYEESGTIKSAPEPIFVESLVDIFGIRKEDTDELSV